MTEEKDIQEIKILSDDPEIADLCRIYWELDDEGEFKHNVSTIAEQLNLKTHQVTGQVRGNCQVYLYDYACSECRKPFYVETRSEFQSAMSRIERGETWICRECKREMEKRAAEQKARELDERRKLIRATYGGREISPVDARSLSLSDAVYLLAYIRIGAYENYSAIRPLNMLDSQLSPTFELDIEIVKQLYNVRLLFVHPDSAPDAFTPEDINTFYLARVAWRWPPSASGGPAEPWRITADIEAIFKNGDWPEAWRTEKHHIALWKNVALHECFQYLYHSLAEHHLEFTPGEKTIRTFESLLDDFSVGQMYNFIWRGAKDAAAFYQRGGVTKKHAANTIVGAVQRYGERAKAEGWDVANYRRIPQCPQSMVTQVFFYSALSLGDDWMNVPIIQ